MTIRRTGYAALAGAVALGAALAGGGSAMQAQVARPIVYVVPIEGVIDLGSLPTCNVSSTRRAPRMPLRSFCA